jgi:hypothetical protein
MTLVQISEDVSKGRVVEQQDGTLTIFIKGKWHDVDPKRHGLIERQPDNYDRLR